ncbi:Histone acetyltransferase HAC1 [Striga hermonthica]|uniref:histone acetyltransferase n=1 Tax=Striga hermonthica TaxID=68872 RepID=A0A9N7NDB7_STRHE|nr:Histone acetyltransferase HAC1 [Striga hermonthica]
MDNRLFGESAYKVQEHFNPDSSRPYNSSYIRRECSFNYNGGSSLLVASDGKTMPSLVDLEQLPQQMSSECHLVGPYVVGPTVSGNFSRPTATSGYLDLIRHGVHAHNTGAATSLGNNIVEPVNSLSNMGFGKPILDQELVSRCRLQALRSKPSSYKPSPPARFGLSVAQMNGFSVGPKNAHNPVLGQRSSKPSQLPIMGHNNSQQQGFCNFQAPEQANMIRNLQKILLSYVKCRLVDANMSSQDFLNHLHPIKCKGEKCKCENYYVLISHFDKCQNTHCGVCGPVRRLCAVERIPTGSGFRKELLLGGVRSRNCVVQEIQPSAKRMKMEDDVQHDDWSLSAVVRQQLKNFVGDLVVVEEDRAEMSKGSSFEGHINAATLNEEIPSSIIEVRESVMSGDCSFDDKMKGNGDTVSHVEEICWLDKPQEMGCFGTAEVKNDGQSLSSGGASDLSEELPMDEVKHDKGEAECGLTKSDCQLRGKSEDLKVSGVSLIDFFLPEQIKEHLLSLNQFTDLGRNVETSERTVDENTCQLCDMGVRLFAPPPMYCTCCGARIKHGSCYYRPLDDEANIKYSFCTLCVKHSRGGNVSFRGLTFPKAKLLKCKNTDELPEGWVQCDKCEAWQHQICALYNSKQDLEGKSYYICPFCRLFELEAKGHTSMPPVLGAKDLPRTKLSDHIEQRLFKNLEKERKRRAELLGKPLEEVPGVDDLVVRVVLALNKQLKVKQQFLDILHGESYPTEFPYKSKVMMLFQKVEGVDVCLFAMYLQEFGSECGHPNKRSVYISYLDSVKYFRPDIKTVDGVPLRTFVYHEILIGYLDYCKQRGFTTCYIWACPPIRGEDYILYCHPETQKTPNPHKLLQWYKKLLKKAKEEKVVVDYTNFYDYFFVPSEECNSKITAARLPYFDGDYWSCAIEDMIRIIEKENEEDSAKKLKIHATKRALRAMGHNDLSVEITKDILVMQKLGQTILPSKEDFFVVHLQFTCTNCHEPILSGSRWSCNQCSKYHLCDRCLGIEQNSSRPQTHTTIHGEQHQLFQILVNDVAGDTNDKDILLDNDFFNDRLSFLKFCQENHYQFDTIRLAKHSSMMIVYHLKTATVQTSMQTAKCCSFCQHGLVSTAEGHCEICSEFSAVIGSTFLGALGELTVKNIE